MYMPDALRALVDLGRADGSRLRYRNAYNLASLSFSAAELADAIRKQMPDFKINYEPDYRQSIADGWPKSIDDTAAREDWDWQPEYDLDAMVSDMLGNLQRIYGRSQPVS